MKIKDILLGIWFVIEMLFILSLIFVMFLIGGLIEDYIKSFFLPRTWQYIWEYFILPFTLILIIYWVFLELYYKKITSIKNRVLFVFFYFMILVGLIFLHRYLNPPKEKMYYNPQETYSMLSTLVKETNQKILQDEEILDNETLPTLLDGNTVLIRLFITWETKINYDYALKKDNLSKMDEYWEYDIRYSIYENICDSFYKYLEKWASFIYTFYNKEWKKVYQVKTDIEKCWDY